MWYSVKEKAINALFTVITLILCILRKSLKQKAVSLLLELVKLYFSLKFKLLIMVGKI